MANVLVQIPATLRVTDEEFLDFVRSNPDLRLERTATGELIVMSPTGSESGNRNAKLIIKFGIWNDRTHLGLVFDSSTGFRLPNGATRAPDVSWVRQDRWDTLTPEERKGFAPLCPDFTLELASPSDDIKKLQAKMEEYLENGCRLGWLLDPQTKQVWVYRPGQSAPKILQDPPTLPGEDVLPGFVLDLSAIWD